MDTEKNDDSEFKFYLTSGLRTEQVAHLLRSQGKDKKEVEAFIDRYVAARNKLAKFIRKFTEKLLMSNVSEPSEVASAGLKYATKHGFSQTEKEAFVRYVLKGNIDGPLLTNQEIGYTDMAKFLGFSTFVGQMLDIKATDQATLNEIARLFENSRALHAAVKNNLASYRDCAYEALTGCYDSNKDNVQLHIHPLIIAMFLPKIDEFEKRMLYSNFGRMIVQKSQHFLRKYLNLNDNYLPRELEQDMELSFDIARDPNSLSYFTDETPISNLLKRFKIQIELWKNVISLRQGRYYSKDGGYDVDDNITGFMRIINSFDWTYFDSPDIAHIQDEATILRKLLGVFSYRPIFSQISTPFNRFGIGYSNISQLTRTTFTNQPLISIRLPVDSSPQNLSSFINQSDWFIENKMLVPKNRSIMYCNGPAMFTINRRYQAINYANLNMNFRYVCLPATVTNTSTINETELACTEPIKIGEEIFKLRSAVVVNKPPVPNFIATGCSAIVIQQRDLRVNRTTPIYWYYNPSTASIMFRNNNGDFLRNKPISPLLENGNGADKPGARELLRKFATILIFTKEPVLRVC
jgi:hypothetical protein